MSRKPWLRLFSTLLLCSTVTYAISGAPASPDTAPDMSQEACAFPEGKPSPATADVRAFGARGNGIDDDTGAIYKAIGSLENGGTVVFPAGTYLHADVLAIRAANITLRGENAVLHAGNPDRGAVILKGENSSIRNLIVTAEAPGSRGEKNEHAGLVVLGRGNLVIGNTVRGSKSAGILIVGAREFVVACNRVSDTKADGIHATGGASDGYIARNSVVNSEDDGIAIVSYSPERQAHDIVVEDNSVAQIRWGRGISVIGSANATIRRNRVKSVAMAAGIIVAREAAYHTPGPRHVTIEENELFDIQQGLAPLGGRSRTGHAAIELNSDSNDPALAVSDVSVVGNSVDGSAYDGIRLLGNVCRVSLASNRLRNIGRRPIAVKGTCPEQVVQCNDNLLGQNVAGCQ